MCPVSPAKAVTLLPVTESSHPFGGALWQMTPMDLSCYGYVEEEYLVEGEAKVYTWPEGQKYPDVAHAPAPYASRILVRKPADSARFSGNVVVEISNWPRGYDRTICAWSNCYEYLMDSGDAWVGVTFSPKVIRNLKHFDPVRYAKLAMDNPLPEDQRTARPQSNTYHGQATNPADESGLSFDFLSQVGIALRENKPGYPMAGYDVKTVLVTGATPGDLATYAAAIDLISCAEDGSNIFDGFLIFMTGAPGNVNQYEEKLHYLDERCKFYGKVPLMRAYTCKDMLGTGHHPDWALMQRRPDSDEAGAYYRSYEIAGTGLMLSYIFHTEPSAEDVARTGLQVKNGRTGKAWTQEELNRFEFPTRYALNAMLGNLKLWVREGVKPPATDPYETVGVYPELDLKEDELGNVMGGLRLPYLRVPAYRFLRDATAEPLPKQTLVELYGSFEGYMERFAQAVEDCVNERILLRSDAEKVLTDAQSVKALFD